MNVAFVIVMIVVRSLFLRHIVKLFQIGLFSQSAHG